MRLLKWTLISSLIVLVGCGRPSSDVSPSRAAGTTGFAADDDGPAYVTGGNEYAETRMAELAAKDDATKPRSSKRDENELRWRLRSFEFTRFDKGSTKPSRLGSDRWELIVYLRKTRPVKFTGTFAGANVERTLVPDRQQRHYVLSATKLVDQTKPEESTDLRFNLTDTKRKDTVEVSYLAKISNVDVRVAKPVAPGSVLECQIKALRENTFGWDNNWVVMNGPTFYLHDIIRTVSTDQASRKCLPDNISFSGESLATSGTITDADGKKESVLYEHEVKSTLGADVRMIGNPAEGNKRMFVVPLKDDQAAETTDAIVTFAAKTPEKITVDPNDTPDLPPELMADFVDDEPTPATSTTPNTTPNAPAKPTPRPKAPQVKVDGAPAPSRGQGFVTYATNQGRSARIVRDFNQNTDVRGVWTWINRYKNEKSWHARFQNYVNLGWPLRGIIQAISRAYDSVAWEALAVVESAYLTGGAYKIQWGDNGRAFGPFQLHVEAAQEGGITPNDRGYFATSACAAAQYLGKRVDDYQKDATVAILAYNRGAGGAAAAIYCSYHAEQKGQRKQCGERINKNFSKNDYNRFAKLAQGYNFTYREMANFGALTPAMLDYVNHKLAAYFVSMDLKHYGFTTANVRTQMPSGTVLPSGGLGAIRDQTCRQAVQQGL